MRLLIGLLLSFTLFSGTYVEKGKDCKVVNSAFQSNELLYYKVFYNWGVIWVEAGEAAFTCKLTNYKEKPAYYFTGTGRTFDKYSWIYKVRDKYESYADTANLKPYRFIRDVKEGGSETYEDCLFSFKKGMAYSVLKTKKSIKIDSAKLSSCSIDVMTAIYYARCLDYSTCKPNDTIPFDLFLENKNYPIYIRYLGKEVKEISGLGKFNCIKFKPLLIEGTIFKGGEDMTVWVTDDKNKIPVYVETPILVGKIKVRLAGYSGLRNEVSSKVK